MCYYLHAFLPLQEPGQGIPTFPMPSTWLVLSKCSDLKQAQVLLPRLETHIPNTSQDPLTFPVGSTRTGFPVGLANSQPNPRSTPESNPGFYHPGCKQDTGEWGVLKFLSIKVTVSCFGVLALSAPELGLLGQWRQPMLYLVRERHSVTQEPGQQ